MHIAVPAAGGLAGARLTDTEEIRFYEDDHGQVLRSRAEAVSGGFDAVLALLEREGVDVVLCGPLSAPERAALAADGFLLAPAENAAPEEALKAYLRGAVFCDPGNTCTYCRHRAGCAIEQNAPPARL